MEVVPIEFKTASEAAGDDAPDKTLVQPRRSHRRGGLSALPNTSPLLTRWRRTSKTVILSSGDGTKKRSRSRPHARTAEQGLSFKGIYAPTPAPGMFLINVMSKRERGVPRR